MENPTRSTEPPCRPADKRPMRDGIVALFAAYLTTRPSAQEVAGVFAELVALVRT